MPRGRSKPPVLSVVVPTRNEAANVNALWGRLSAALGKVSFEVCFVDDSDDGTTTLLSDLERQEPDRVRCLLRRGEDRRGGLSTAVVAGLRLAQGHYVCVMDADLQHPPETIPAMLESANAGADVVVGSRYVRGGASHGLDGAMRRIVSRGAGATARILFSEARRSTDPLSGFFLCRRDLIDGIEFRPVGFKILLELLVCIPNAVVRDIPLTFQPRAAGESKASLRQGLLFLGHLRSLFVDVEGSARFWKFGLVGVSGLIIFLPLLALASGPLHLAPEVAFFPAYIPSVIWNTVGNRVWTFADQRRNLRRGEARRYLERAVLSGLVMYGVYLLLIAAHLEVVLAGLLGALVAMLINGATNHHAVRRRPRLWTEVSADRAVREFLAQLARDVHADRAYLLPPRHSVPATVPSAVLDRVVRHRRPTIWTEAASHRAQRRTNIDISSTLLLPVVSGGDVLGVVVCERHSPRAYSPDVLETATRALEDLVPVFTAAAESPEARARGGSPAPVSAPRHV